MINISLNGRHFVVLTESGRITEVMENDSHGHSVADSVEEPQVWSALRALTGLN